MSQSLKIGWYEFVAAAVSKLRETHPTLSDHTVFMVTNTYEPDSEAYCTPEYVLIALTRKERGNDATGIC